MDNDINRGAELSAERIAGIKARNAARSPGPLRLVDEADAPLEIRAADHERYPHPVAICAGYRCEADAAFFAAAPEDITDLLAERAMRTKLYAAHSADVKELRSERDFLKRREKSIIDATEPADDGKYRADIAGAILRQRRQLDEARAEVDRLRAERAATQDTIAQLRAAALPAGAIEELRSFGPLADVTTSLMVAREDVDDLCTRDHDAEERLRKLDRAIACLVHAHALIAERVQRDEGAKGSYLPQGAGD